MTRITSLIAAAALAYFSGVTPAQAHHGYAGFDKQTPVTFQATVTEFHFVSPHSVIDFEVTDAKGQVQNWQAEITSRINLTPHGWTPNTLEPGDKITLTGYRAGNGVHSLWVTKIVLASGKELSLGGGK